MTRTNLKDDYTITEALMLVRDAAREGRKLEAWHSKNERFRYNHNSKQWHVFNDTGVHRFNVTRQEGHFTPNEVLGTWHVREVKDED